MALDSSSSPHLQTATTPVFAPVSLTVLDNPPVGNYSVSVLRQVYLTYHAVLKAPPCCTQDRVPTFKAELYTIPCSLQNLSQGLEETKVSLDR